MVAQSKNTGKGTGALTTKGRWECVINYRHMHSYVLVGHLLQVSQNTVRRWVLQEAVHGHVDDLPKGQPQRKEVRTKRFLAMVKKTIDDKYKDGDGISQKQLSREYECSRATIDKAVSDIGYAWVNTVKSQTLSDKNRALRLAYIAANSHMSAEDWDDVCFQDEKMFRCTARFPTRVIGDPKKPPLPRRRDAKWYGGQGIMMWMAYSVKYGKVGMFEQDLGTPTYPKTVTEESFEADMKIHFYPILRAKPGMQVVIDGATVHNESIRTMMDVMHVHVVDHPPVSPDFNPIENVWSIMKHRIATFEKPKNRHELRAAIWKVWNALTDAELTPYFRNMPKRFAECVKLGGGRTSY